jgi:renal tumor antigen
MDLWGAGCVFFEVLSLFPLFPGNNEKDQIHKIHNILGTPPKELLERFQKNSKHIDFNFPHVTGTGIAQLYPHVSPECQEFISKLLTYNPDERITARQAINCSYFKDLRSQDAKIAPPTIQKELGGGSPTSATEEDKVDAQDQAYHQTMKRTTKVTGDTQDFILKKKLQQGSKKNSDHNPDPVNEYEDQVNNVNN